MAYRAWSDYKWQQVWSNGKYAIDVQWRYKQDPVANKTFYSATALRIRSLDSYHSFRSSSAVAGIATITSDRSTHTVSANVAASSSQTFNLADVGREVNHPSDGSTSGMTLNVHGYFDAGLGGQYDTPTGGWHSPNVASQIASIDRRGPTVSASVSSIGVNSVQLKLTSNMLTTTGSYRINGGSWTRFTPPSQLGVSGGGTGYFTIGGLEPNTKYTIQIECKRDYNEVWSNDATVTFTTAKPPAPARGTVSVSGITPTSAVFKASDFLFGGYGATFGRYDFAKNHEDSWHNNGTSSVYNATGLTPNTDYQAHCRLVDNYGTASSTATKSFRTPKPPSPSAGAVRVIAATPTSITVQASDFKFGGYGATFGYYDFSRDAGWINNGRSDTYVFSNLEPNTTYHLSASLVDNYGSRSSIVSTYFTTPKPAAPTAGTISVSDVTPFGATVNLTGWEFDSLASWGYFQYRLNGSSWSQTTSSVINLTGLSEETDYLLEVRLVDNYDTPSAIVSSSFKTLVDQAKIDLKIENEWFTGKSFFKTGGVWKKAKYTYAKDSVWKKGV